MNTAFNVSGLVEETVKTVENVIRKPLSYPPTTVFLLLWGLLVITHVLLYWESSPTECRTLGKPCNYTTINFKNIFDVGLTIFIYVFLVVVVAKGVHSHGISAKAFIPFAAICIVAKLFTWLLYEVFGWDKSVPPATPRPDIPLIDILKAEPSLLQRFDLLESAETGSTVALLLASIGSVIGILMK